ncbi:MAG: HesA/MoeB/ThiF family protein [Magnetococcales bacterium]|nr:HesA/MoeB/ThiF family protein [Magnetococcales bacterium]MBF0148879.1 HesA/MoeB/ThiF family protein [Magnetococcales bacterium]MBF0630080.1 HesA/MoeB/ThiF family protein [Magnetococcales bacterium]
MSLDDAQIERYSRQLLLKEWGGAGQEQLLNSRVFLLGVGGLGAPAALYLAAAGVGTLIIADSDRVERSNLQRQILYGTPDIGQPKGETAARVLRRLNPDVEVQVIGTRVTDAILDDLLPRCDLALDASDNFDTRYALNAACLRHGKRLVTGAVLGFEGQVAVFHHGIDANASCYRCLYPAPSQRCQATCATAGVLGGVAGMIGTLQAVEAIKELLGIGTTLAGQVLLINTLDTVFHRVRVPRNPSCPTCRRS